MVRFSLFVLAVLVGRAGALGTEGGLLTQWAADVSMVQPWPEYPRPQMVRAEWTNLNGHWDYAILPKDAARPEQWDGEILVPYCIESALSGVKKTVSLDQRLWYRRSFDTAELKTGRRTLIHFGAVDWECTVWVNGREVGSHQGGYDAFSFDITDALREGSNELVVAVLDPTNKGYQPRGKQVLEPGGIWYTAVTGVWQTVWLEEVPATYIDRLRMTTDPKAGTARIEVSVVGDLGVSLSGRVSRFGQEIAAATGKVGEPLTLEIEDPHPWSPADPFLYDVGIVLGGEDGKMIDAVKSYFGLRSIEVAKDDAGVLRLFLNGEPLFQYGLLDQGWWPDGLYTAPTDEALRYDIEVSKTLGFNMARKHVKIEPQRWYTWCDRLGLLVWQDMPSGDAYIGGDSPDITRSVESAHNFERELHRMVDGLQNHPAIVMWVPFNEGWGQWDTGRVSDLIKQWDPTRPVNSASGWTDRGVGDIRDIHSYPGPAMPTLEQKRAAVLGEFGGLGLPVKKHTWQDEKNWGYRSFETPEDLTTAYLGLLHRLQPLVWKGLAAAVYTQTTDVEIEINGVMTYDRARIKMPVQPVREAAMRLYLPPPGVVDLASTSAEKEVNWRYTTDEPGEGWIESGFDDSAWKSGPGGFGEPSTPGSAVKTSWKSDDIWLRRELELSEVAGEMRLLVHHDEDAEIYLNGVLAAELAGYTTGYEMIPLTNEAIAGVRKGPNLLAIHCHQTAGGQYIDAGLVELQWKER
ncbi:MAG: sugar-binding domain-containing protein [Planctomycetota bacterium]